MRPRKTQNKLQKLIRVRDKSGLSYLHINQFKCQSSYMSKEGLQKRVKLKFCTHYHCNFHSQEKFFPFLALELILQTMPKIVFIFSHFMPTRYWSSNFKTSAFKDVKELNPYLFGKTVFMSSHQNSILYVTHEILLLCLFYVVFNTNLTHRDIYMYYIYNLLASSLRR